MIQVTKKNCDPEFLKSSHLPPSSTIRSSPPHHLFPGDASSRKHRSDETQGCHTSTCKMDPVASYTWRFGAPFIFVALLQWVVGGSEPSWWSCFCLISGDLCSTSIWQIFRNCLQKRTWIVFQPLVFRGKVVVVRWVSSLGRYFQCGHFVGVK